jgi:hypothetical protein
MKRLIRKLKTVVFLSSRQKKLVLLVFCLAIYRNILLLRRSKEAFTEHICQNYHRRTKVKLTNEKIAIANDITMAITIANKCIPWKNVCRHQSWQAVRLLLKYQIPFDYTVGIRKVKTKSEGHSWVKVELQFICGRCNERQYLFVFSTNEVK